MKEIWNLFWYYEHHSRIYCCCRSLWEYGYVNNRR